MYLQTKKPGSAKCSNLATFLSKTCTDIYRRFPYGALNEKEGNSASTEESEETRVTYLRIKNITMKNMHICNWLTVDG